jgi:hypothetical protein
MTARAEADQPDQAAERRVRRRPKHAENSKKPSRPSTALDGRCKDRLVVSWKWPEPNPPERREAMRRRTFSFRLPLGRGCGTDQLRVSGTGVLDPPIVDKEHHDGYFG